MPAGGQHETGERIRGSRQDDWVEAMVEIPRGSRNKYEYDHERHIFTLDRVLYSSVHYPTDYGFIPGTLAGDGDPLDVLIVVEEPTFPGCHVRMRPIGTLVMTDEKGEDEKILGVLVDDPRFSAIHELKDLNVHWQKEITAFFKTYKELQPVSVQPDVKGWAGVEKAWTVIEECSRRFDEQSTGA